MSYLIEQPFLYTLQVSDGNILDKSGTAKWIFWTMPSVLQIGIFEALKRLGNTWKNKIDKTEFASMVIDWG